MKKALIAVAGMALAVVLSVGMAQKAYADHDSMWAFSFSLGYSSGWPCFAPVYYPPVVVAPSYWVVPGYYYRPVVVGVRPSGYFQGYTHGYNRGYRQGFRQGLHW